jgi:hypothetical protein
VTGTNVDIWRQSLPTVWLGCRQQLVALLSWWLYQLAAAWLERVEQQETSEQGGQQGTSLYLSHITHLISLTNYNV